MLAREVTILAMILYAGGVCGYSYSCEMKVRGTKQNGLRRARKDYGVAWTLRAEGGIPETSRVLCVIQRAIPFRYDCDRHSPRTQRRCWTGGFDQCSQGLEQKHLLPAQCSSPIARSFQKPLSVWLHPVARLVSRFSPACGQKSPRWLWLRQGLWDMVVPY